MASVRNQLIAIKRLRLSDGLTWQQAHDIRLWDGLCGAQHDVSVLSDKTAENIAAIYRQFYIEE